jgi:UDP-N-acetylmuramyl pentapeptide phosphotransferase/UDP-N-acetylglucosamine-1-phosphate transferase
MAGFVQVTQTLGGGVAAMLVTRTFGGMVANSAQKRGWLDHPNNRSSHRRPVPRIGGIVVVPVCALAVLFDGQTRMHIVVPAVVMGLALVGLVDDFLGIGIGIRLAAQVLGSAIIVAFSPSVRPLRIFGATLDFGVVVPIVLFCWILVSINVFNFVDGIDGMAGGVLLANAVTWIVVTRDSGLSTRVGAVFLGCSVGFLALNRSPARIFLGDVGSFGIGFLIAVLPLTYALAGGLLTVPIFVALPSLADTFCTAARRVLRGENLFLAHRSHLYQRLAVRFGHTRVSVSACLLSTGSGLVGWFAFISRVEESRSTFLTLIAGLYLFSIVLFVAIVGQQFDKCADG